MKNNTKWLVVYVFSIGLIAFFAKMVVDDIDFFQEMEKATGSPEEIASIHVMNHYSKLRIIGLISIKVLSFAVILSFIFFKRRWSFLLFNAVVIPNLLRVLTDETRTFFRGHGNYPLVSIYNIIFILSALVVYWTLSRLQSEKKMLRSSDIFNQLLFIISYIIVEQFIICWFT